MDAALDPMAAQAAYDAKYREYQDVMHAGAWRIGWSFFGVFVGLLPMMYVFIWLIGAKAWERTFFHAPLLMWLAAPLSLGTVVFLLFRVYRRNLELDEVKRRYLAELRDLKASIPQAPRPERKTAPEPDWDSFRN